MPIGDWRLGNNADWRLASGEIIGGQRSESASAIDNQ